MTNNTKIIYQRILLKLSGEALQGEEGFGIDNKLLKIIALEIKELIKLGIEVGIVIGGGNLFRGSKLAKSGISHVVGDYMGMLATIMNGLAICDTLNHISVNTKLMSAIPLNGICNIFNLKKAISLLQHKNVIIFSGGIGNPFFTTDSAACLRGLEIKADIILKATKVNGVYSSDPNKNNKAFMYKKLSYKEVLKHKLKIMDLTAFTLAQDHNLPILIFNIKKPNALRDIIFGKNIGTLITHN
ncbi:UMP kinase [Candidatus Providencia siddallii]|uniref:Uridylate kinase n=1 Tax=Candidatus Providencia siddallii TaxID=1715285 RepID=A0ABM9NNX7_9GAMM